jgi:carbonic anhydrase
LQHTGAGARARVCSRADAEELVKKRDLRLDLGVGRLVPEWRAMLSRANLKDDVVAGITVACVAIPLSLAIALASGVAPAAGLVTAIVAGIVCALFGGTRLAVSGPAAAMAVLIASLVQQYGLAALLVVGVGCGVLQLLTGVLGLGRFVRLVPLPVVEGFTAGIGAIILIGQLPRALGLPPPTQSHVFDVVTHIGELLHQTRPAAVLITIAALVVIFTLPKLTRRIPAHLAAVVLGTVAVALLPLDLETIGEIPRSLPLPRMPEMPSGVAASSLVASVFVVYAVASLETLLSSTAVDKLAGGPRSDPDQELIGQGLGNIASAVFGGIPVTGVIARSATNVQAGAKTRRAVIVHALALVLAVVAFAPFIGRIPVAALAAVLFSVAFRMLDPRVFVRLWSHSRNDGLVFVVTFFVIVLVGLLEGVQWGIAAALVIAAIRLGRTRLTVVSSRVAGHHAFKLEGPLTFMSSLGIETLRSSLDAVDLTHGVVLDVHDVQTMDASGAEMLASVIEQAHTRGLPLAVVGLTEEQRAQLVAAAGDPAVTTALAASERDAAAVIGRDASAELRLRVGVERYRSSIKPRYLPLFQRLADGQAPHTLFITCCDSRIDPNLMTSTDPGELFIVRDIGNIVPADGAIRGSSVAAAIEYAVGVLGVRKVVVCGHSSCGAIKALLEGGDDTRAFPNLESWLEATEARDLIRAMPRSLSSDEISRVNVLAQLDRLRGYRIVREALAKGTLTLAAWFFDVATGDLEEWSESAGRFASVGASEPGAARGVRQPAEEAGELSPLIGRRPATAR